MNEYDVADRSVGNEIQLYDTPATIRAGANRAVAVAF